MEFRPQLQLRSNVVKNALKVYVVGPLASKYQVCAVRSLCVDGVSKEKIWITRRLLESLLEENPYVVCFFSCITALSEGNCRKKNQRSNKVSSNSEDETVAEQTFCPGISLWIVFNWPESGLAAFEEYISKENIMDIIFHLRVTNNLILKFEKRSFWKTSFKVLSFTIISVPRNSEKRNRKTNKCRKACGSAFFENWHWLFTLKVVY